MADQRVMISKLRKKIHQQQDSARFAKLDAPDFKGKIMNAIENFVKDLGDDLDSIMCGHKHQREDLRRVMPQFVEKSDLGMLLESAFGRGHQIEVELKIAIEKLDIELLVRALLLAAIRDWVLVPNLSTFASFQKDCPLLEAYRMEVIIQGIYNPIPSDSSY